MKMEMKDEMGVAIERLSAATSLLEQAVERLEAGERAFAISAQSAQSREAELERKLQQAEATIAELQGRAAGAAAGGRKTLVPGVTSLLGKGGEPVEAGALDAALVSLSPEQRIAVKAQLLRAGLV